MSTASSVFAKLGAGAATAGHPLAASDVLELESCVQTEVGPRGGLGKTSLSRCGHPSEESHRTIDPLCLENPRPAGAESFPESHCFSFSISVPSLSDSDDADQFLELTSRRLPVGATHRSI